jgi:succinate-semialdehyde dehydrogenase/glutarate-semialdehyde dehydrogenase
MKDFLKSINPATGGEIARYGTDEPQLVRSKLERAGNAFEKWAELPLSERAAYLLKLSGYLKEHKEDLAKVATDEMGKPFKQSIAEVEKCALSLAYYAENGERFLENEVVITKAQKSFVSFQPLGPVLAIMPWNFPYWQVFRAMGPILVAGNTMVLKHASNVTGCALAMEKAVREAGLPADIFQALILPSSAMEAVIADKNIKAVTFTGSTSAGRKVAATAASCLKKQVLELGGSDAYVVLADAALEEAVRTCVRSRLNNSGQSCIAAKRFIVDKKVIASFTEKMVAEMKAKNFGDPMLPLSDLGPLARMDLRDDLHEQVKKSIALGAKVLCGGFIPDTEGAYYPPTVLTGVKKGMPAYDEELFGPVAAIIEAEEEEDAIEKANDSVFGLGSAIFSTDLAKAERIAEKKLQAGSVFVNDFVSSNPLLPFGGIKESGYGRELSYFAIREFVNIKTISIK